MNIPKVGKLRESEARLLVLQIAATFPGHSASTTEIKRAVPSYRELTAADLLPSSTRANEHMWEQIIGNATGSHGPSSVSIFNKGYATKTTNGIKVTEKGIAHLKNKGLYE
jgi:hypothetical protein